MTHERNLPAQVRAVVEELHARLDARFGERVLDVRRFGSCARGESTEGSDVDVFVLLRQMTWSDKKAVLDAAADLWTESGLFVSPTVFDVERWERLRRERRALALDIERDGIPL